MSFLEQDRFDRVTAWLNGFTTHDLSTLDASGCKSIDDWLQRMDSGTQVRVIHSTGTSGKLSFLPRGTLEMDRMVTGSPISPNISARASTSSHWTPNSPRRSSGRRHLRTRR
jgi:hypothetical protein